MKRLTLSIVTLGCAVAAQAAGTALYETGPAQDAAFVRFVNATPQGLEVVSGKARLRVPVDKPVSDYLSVKPNTTIGGTIEGAGQVGKVDVKTKPSAFATVVAVPGGDAKTLRTLVISEAPDDFNGLKSAIAFYNFDAGCKAAGLQTTKAVAMFSNVADKAVQRRMVNPIALAVQPTCEGKPRGGTVDLGMLQAGQRYSLLLVPTGPGASRLMFVADEIAR